MMRIELCGYQPLDGHQMTLHMLLEILHLPFSHQRIVKFKQRDAQCVTSLDVVKYDFVDVTVLKQPGEK